MNLVISGGTGFIGSALCAGLLEKGHTLALLTRREPPDSGTPAKVWVRWTPGARGDWERVVDGADGLINLAGEPIAGKRWTADQKRGLRASRIEATRSLVEAVAKARQKPKFLLNASAVGYYGPRGDEMITEEAGPGSDFLAALCREWEEEAQRAEPLGLRVVRLRTGIVLGRGGGALAKMTPPFKFFAGGPLGSGTQWMPWIHLEDEIGLILHLVEAVEANGPVNAAAPNPVRMREFCQALGEVMRRPCWAPVPAFALRLVLGEMADMLLTGQRAIPAAAERLGYRFRYSDVREALRACLPL
jgi:uncharacterized protein (TIGR01777 family)